MSLGSLINWTNLTDPAYPFPDEAQAYLPGIQGLYIVIFFPHFHQDLEFHCHCTEGFPGHHIPDPLYLIHK